jgi:hypothetical protein
MDKNVGFIAGGTIDNTQMFTIPNGADGSIG